MGLRQLVACLSIVLFCATSVQAISVDTVLIGNPGNPADTRYIPTGVGSVGYAFRIGETEITNTQYAAFLNAVATTDSYGLYGSIHFGWGGIDRFGTPGSYSYAVRSPTVGAGPGGTDFTYHDKPAAYISWGDAARFANWMHNGQPTGPQDASTTEDGAYALNGAITQVAFSTVTRKPGARWWIPNQDEWYKAAYYDPNAGVYFDYPTGTNSVPNNNLPTADTGNSANYWNGAYTTGSSLYPLTDVGAYTTSASSYGTYDQGGNAWEWLETIVNSGPSAQRALRGGSWIGTAGQMSAQFATLYFPQNESAEFGFRIATGTGIPGDFDLDNDVDGIDFLKWQRGELSVAHSPTDLEDWESNYGTDLDPLASAVVPEPGRLCLGALVASCVTIRRWRTRFRRSVRA